MTTLVNRQATTAHWKIMADYPPRDGDYMVVSRTESGDIGNPDIWSFEKGSWEPLFGYTSGSEPEYWLDVQMPK